MLDRVSVKVANLLAAADPAAASYNTANSPSITLDIVSKAKALDAELLLWWESLPRDWIPISVFKRDIPQEVIDVGLYGDSCNIYPDIIICSTINDWRIARLKVLVRIAQLGGEEDKAQAFSTIQDLADGICATIPFCLGNRTRPLPIRMGGAVYPSLPNDSVRQSHHITAAAWGGWYLCMPMTEVLKVGMYLREGQQEWMLAQLARLATAYDIDPEDQLKNARLREHWTSIHGYKSQSLVDQRASVPGVSQMKTIA